MESQPWSCANSSDVVVGERPRWRVAAGLACGQDRRRPRQRMEGGRGRHRPAGGKALAQTSAEGPKRLFNLCVNDKVKFRDLDVSVAFKAVAGKIDQGGGLVWRYKDHNNYYLARMNPLENNYRVYKVVGGKRTQLATVDLKAAAGWHTLRSCPPGQSHPVPIRRQTVSRRKRQHVPEGRQDRPLDQGRRTNAFRRSAGRGLSAWGNRGPKP